MTLHFQELQPFQPALFIEAFCPILLEKALDLLRRPIEDHFNIPVPRVPHILKDPLPFFLKDTAQFIPQKIQRLPHGFSPLLIPPGLSSGAATTILLPSPHAMGTAPGGALSFRPLINLHFMNRGKTLQKSPVI